MHECVSLTSTVAAVPQMGYGTRALELLQMYYEGKFPTMDENGQTDDSEITPVNSEVISEPEVGRFYLEGRLHGARP